MGRAAQVQEESPREVSRGHDTLKREMENTKKVIFESRQLQYCPSIKIMTANWYYYTSLVQGKRPMITGYDGHCSLLKTVFVLIVHRLILDWICIGNMSE